MVSLGETRIGGSNEVFSQLVTLLEFGLVCLGPAGGVAGLGDLSFTGGEDGAEVLQLDCSVISAAPVAGQIQTVVPAREHKLGGDWLEVCAFDHLIPSKIILSLHPHLLLLKVGDDILPHFHDVH